MNYKVKYDKIKFSNLPYVVRNWVELLLGYLALDRWFFFSSFELDTLSVLWVSLKFYQCLMSISSLIIWELVEDEG